MRFIVSILGILYARRSSRPESNVLVWVWRFHVAHTSLKLAEQTVDALPSDISYRRYS